MLTTIGELHMVKKACMMRLKIVLVRSLCFIMALSIMVFSVRNASAAHTISELSDEVQKKEKIRVISVNLETSLMLIIH